MNRIRLIGTVLSCLAFSAPAFAHKLIVDCRIDGDRLRVEAYYDDETPAQQAKIVVEDEQKKVVADGRTDDRGLWSCPAPVPGKYVIRAESVGHVGKKTLVIDDSAATKTPSDSRGANQTISARESSSPAEPNQRESTQTPWLRIGIGFVVIALLCGTLLLIRRRRPHP